MKPGLALTTILTCPMCIVALACGHEISAPATVSTSAPNVAAAPTADEPPATDCIELDAERGGTRITLEGRIVVDDAYEHPTRGKTHPFILHLDVPRCAIGLDETDIDEIHLASSEDVALRPLAGMRVRVSGDPFVAHTAWHARPVVLMTITANRL
jgi:hypothetical protein